MPGYGYDDFGVDYFGKGSHSKDILWKGLPSFYRNKDGESILSFQGVVGQGDGLLPKTILVPYTAIKPTTFSVSYIALSVAHTLTDDAGDGVLYESGSPTSYGINYVTGKLTLPVSDNATNITASFSYYEKYLEKFTSALAIVFEEMRFLTENFDTLIDPLAIRPDLLYNLSSNLALLEQFWLKDETFCRLFLENVGTWTLRKGEVFGIKLLARCLGFEAEVVDLWEYELLPTPTPPPPPPLPIPDLNPVDDYSVRAGDGALCGKNYTPDTNDVFFYLAHQSEWLSEAAIIAKPEPAVPPPGWIPYADRRRWNTNKFYVIVS